MSGGKKQYPKKKTYSEGQMRKAVKDAAEEAIARILLLCVVAARDQFNMNEDKTVEFVETMQRYVDYESMGLIDLNTASDSLYKHTGIDIRIKK